MANFPNTQPNLANPISTDQMNTVPHAAQHANANDEIEAIAGFVGTVGSSNPTNLLSNGDLEIWSAGTSAAPDGWTYSGAGGSVAREASTIKLGTYSAVVTRAGTDCNLYQIFHSTKGIVYWKGRTVTFGCWVYATVANRARLNLQDDADSYSSYHTGDSTWQWLTVTRTVGSSATLVLANCRVDSGNTTAYFDGAIAVEGAACPSFAPKPAAEGTNGTANNVQLFDSSGTWVKPSTGTMVKIVVWGGGGSGGRGSSSQGGAGGGGGSCVEMLIPLSALSATVAVTVGAGGAARTVNSTSGAIGGNSTFGSYLTAYGGAGGIYNGVGGGGGGYWGAAHASNGTGGQPAGGVLGSLVMAAQPNGTAIGALQTDANNELTNASFLGAVGSTALTGGQGVGNFYGGGGGGAAGGGPGIGDSGGQSFWGGGGGQGSSNTGNAAVASGGRSVWGGGGGGSGATSVAGGLGGVSISGGAGGAGSFDANAATSGSQPGGGGGGSETGNSGAGGNGRCIIIVL